MQIDEGRRVLIAAPYGRDAETLAGLLARRGFTAVIYPHADAMAGDIDETAGLILVSEEALRGDLAELRYALADQPPWSDIPILLLATRQPRRVEPSELAHARLPPNATTVLVLERPLGAESLCSAVESALRSRQRQFDLRNRLDEIGRAAATLEQKVAERTSELQAELAHRVRIEAALRQSQKMEALGQLTSGIAHDFNNMLTGIIGSLDIIRRRLDVGRLEGLERYLDAAGASAQRAATLTQRLLAFSRRQSLDIKPLDVSKLVRSLGDLLERSINEQISLRIVTEEDLAAVTDANQLESAILNLVVNARDAMPGGGRLIVEAKSAVVAEGPAAQSENLSPGRYVVVTVSDTGVGMSPEIREKVFEPFFTTKPIGQGTGLGLSMVYGFAQQSGGQVRIHSQSDEGTSVEIYLPASDQSVALGERLAAPTLTNGGGRNVLLVEDDESVRLLVSSVLEELGYASIEVADPHRAIPILASDRELDLMISDVGLPGINGRQLAEIARAHRPDLPILFMTAYAGNAARRSAFLAENMDMIIKPFRLEVLAAKISEMLRPAE